MAKKKIKRYKVSPDESLGLAFSVVNSPAVESDFQFFSEQKLEKFVGVEGERRMIYGCALRPSFPIYRRTEDEEYYLEFDREAIDKISKNYFKMGFQANWTEAHKDEVEGLTITESWIKEDMQADKSIALGLDPSLPVGSWFIGCYCENDEIWASVKEGKYHGFSIEAIVGVEDFEKQVEELNSNNMDKTNEEMFLDKLRNVLKEFFTSKKTEDEELAANSGFSSVEEYKAEVEAIKEELAEETPVAEPAPEPVVEEPKPEPAPVVEEPKAGPAPAPEPEPKAEPDPIEAIDPDANKPSYDHLEELIGNLRAEIEALKNTNGELQDKIKDMGKQPSAAPVNVNAKPGAGDTYSAWRETMRHML